MNSNTPTVSLVKTFQPNESPIFSVIFTTEKSAIAELSMDEAKQLHELLGEVLEEANSNTNIINS